MSTAPLPFGVALPNYGSLANRDNLLRLARLAEAQGIDSIWVADHLVAPVGVASFYPYDRREAPKPGDMGVIEHFYEPLTTLAFLAGATERIRLGVSVLVVPYRNPVVTAKIAASLDALSGGRLVLGVGVGWLREEFTAVGADARVRGAVTDEYLQIFRRLWGDEVAAFDGHHYRLPPVRTGPKPAQGANLPIWVGGNSDAALARALAYGDGWHLIDLSLEEAAPRLDALRRARAARDERGGDVHRNDGRFTVSLRQSIRVQTAPDPHGRPLFGTVDAIRRKRDAYAAAGIDYLVLNPDRTSRIEELEESLVAIARCLAD